MDKHIWGSYHLLRFLDTEDEEVFVTKDNKSSKKKVLRDNYTR